jgi:hypothetical protein
VHSLAQDKENENLLFAGTEFSFFFSIDGGNEWVQLKAGLPTIPVRHITIQERENDLVIATFGRGFYILDDYTPLRNFTPDILKLDAKILTVKDALMFVQTGGKYGQGSTYFAAKNPPYGATFTYYIKEPIKTLKQMRQEKEKKLLKEGKPIPYPSWDELRAEDNEEPSYLIFTIRDETNNIVNKLTSKDSKGINRITWNLNFQVPGPVRTEKFNPLGRSRRSFAVLPGKYYVALAKNVRGEITELAGPVEFNVVPLNNTALEVTDQNRREIVEFQQRAAKLGSTVQGTLFAVNELASKIESIKQAIFNTPGADNELMVRARKLESELNDILIAFNGDRTISRRNENPPTGLMRRVRTMNSRSFNYLTQTSRDAFRIVSEEFPSLHTKVKKLIGEDLKNLEEDIEKAGIPWTLGRVPELN